MAANTVLVLSLSGDPAPKQPDQNGHNQIGHQGDDRRDGQNGDQKDLLWKHSNQKIRNKIDRRQQPQNVRTAILCFGRGLQAGSSFLND